MYCYCSGGKNSTFLFGLWKPATRIYFSRELKAFKNCFALASFHDKAFHMQKWSMPGEFLVKTCDVFGSYWSKRKSIVPYSWGLERPCTRIRCVSESEKLVDVVRCLPHSSSREAILTLEMLGQNSSFNFLPWMVSINFRYSTLSESDSLNVL